PPGDRPRPPRARGDRQARRALRRRLLRPLAAELHGQAGAGPAAPGRQLARRPDRARGGDRGPRPGRPGGAARRRAGGAQAPPARSSGADAAPGDGGGAPALGREADALDPPEPLRRAVPDAARLVRGGGGRVLPRLAPARRPDRLLLGAARDLPRGAPRRVRLLAAAGDHEKPRAPALGRKGPAGAAGPRARGQPGTPARDLTGPGELRPRPPVRAPRPDQPPADEVPH